MATKKTYYKNITHIPGQITITLPDGSKRKFKSSTEAQAFFDKNYGDKYSMEIVSTQDNKGEITINGGELPEVVVTGKAPAKKPESDDSRPAFNPSERRGVDKWIGANHSPRFNRAYNRMGMNPLNWPKYIPKSYWDSETHRNVVEGGNIAAGMVAAPFALKAMGAAYAVPEIAGALNLWGAYEGLGRLTSDEGVQKTYNKFKEGDWWEGAKSLGGDALDVAMSLPFLNRMRQITQTTGKGLFSMGMANEFSRLHPTYNFKYNWRTGKFDLTPKPGAAAEATTMAKTDMLPGQVRELPGAPRALGSANPETYGSMNEVADALEAGELPTSQQMPIANQQTTRPYFAQRNIPDPSNLNDEELASYINMLESTDAPMSSLTPEALEPIKAPTIITSSEGLPTFSRLSQGTDWGRALGVDPGFNAQIDFGLQRPRPTIEQVRNALGISGDRNGIAHGDAHFGIEGYDPNYTENMPLIETPYDVPILHLNMVPYGGGELAQADKLWLGKQMSSLSAGAKGVDIASTGNINPTVSRFVSDLSAATNLSDMDRYNILKMFLENPEHFYRQGFNGGDYSPFSWLNNAIMGNKPKRFFTEPSRNTYVGDFNNYGSELESPIKGLFNMNPSQLGTESPGISLDPDRATLIQNWMKENIPNLYTIPQDRTKVPFPVTTFRKKGGKLVKKKFKLNGKKTCK